MKKGWKNFWITCGVVAGIGCVCLISGKVMGATLTVMDNYIPDWIGLGRGEAGVSYDYGDAPMEADTDKTYGDIHALKLDTEGLNVQILKGTGSGITVQTEDIYSALKFQVTEEDINIGISIQKGNTELKEALDSVLSKMTEEDFSAMMDEAISVQPLAG